MVSGCALFPEKLSCINVPWSAEAQADEMTKWITAWARHPRAGLYSLEDNSWFADWWLPKYRTFLIDWLISGAAVLCAYLIFAALNRFKNIKFFDIRYIATALFATITIAFWFWKAPTPRFGTGAFIIFFAALFIFASAQDHNSRQTRLTRMVIVVVIAAFVFSISNPGEYFSVNRLIKFKIPSIPTAAVKQDDVFGVRPVEGDLCWMAPECSPYDRPDMKTRYGYKAFLTE
jgi:hypothetical protein